MTDVIDRRSFLKASAVAGATATSTSVLGLTATMPASRAAGSDPEDPFRWSEATIAELQTAMTSGETSALALTRDYLARIEAIDWRGPRINSIIEMNPDAEAVASALDAERAVGNVRGPLHGIPIVLKDVLATADHMETTAGSLALVGSTVPRDAGAVAKLRDGGAILLGKANMSEWNAFRGWPTHGGWSGRAGMGLNPYAINHSTGDSSSGSAAAVAANLAAGAVGLETYGSIVMPSSLCGLVGLKPTSGLVSRSGTIPISFTRDVIGPMGRTVADVAAMLTVMAGADPLDPLTDAAEGHIPADYRSFLDPGALRGARLGVWRREGLWKPDGQADVIEAALDHLRELGATIVDPVELPEWKPATGEHITVMFYEFRHGIRDYLSGLTGTSIRTLADVVAFNEAHPEQELAIHAQNTLEAALEEPPLTDPRYRRALRLSRRLGRAAFDEPMDARRLDAIVAPSFRPPWLIDLRHGDGPAQGNGAAGPANAAGYPHLTVPAGSVGELPVGLSFMARAWEEPKLLGFGYAFEQATQARRAPRFLEGYGVEEFVTR